MCLSKAALRQYSEELSPTASAFLAIANFSKLVTLIVIRSSAFTCLGGRPPLVPFSLVAFCQPGLMSFSSAIFASLLPAGGFGGRSPPVPVRANPNRPTGGRARGFLC